ncbi:MAG: tetratricopeptide repeat protein [Candidatus Wallbacteria bacterium]|nr:tetratricopeptide repeat protein [Candidatus Wallbacteria bacterium]
MADAKNDELRKLVYERLQNESADNLIGLGTVFGLDRDALESASPIQRVQQLMDGIELAQLADILEIKTGQSAAPPPTSSSELPPPPPESDILAQIKAEPQEGLPEIAGEEALFAEDLTAPPIVEEAEPEIPAFVEPAATLEEAASPDEEASANEEPAPVEEPLAPAVSGGIDDMAAAMLASGELTEEELAELRAQAGEEEPAPSEMKPPEEEVDVLQQLRSVRKDSMRARDREKQERKRRREAATKAADLLPPPPSQLQQFRLWLFRATMLVFIVLVAVRSSVVVTLPDKFNNAGLLIQIKLTGTGTEKLEPFKPPQVANTHGTRSSSGGTPPPPRTSGGTDQAHLPVPSDPEQASAFLERELKSGDLQGTIDLAARSFDLPPDSVKEELFRRAGSAQEDTDKGVALLMAQDLPGAEEVLKQASDKAGPSQARATYLLGHVRRLQGRVDDARQTFQLALSRDPKMAEANHGLGEIELAAGNLPGAEDFCRKAIAARAEYLDAYYCLADVLKKQGRVVDAAATYKQLLAKDPKQSYALFSSGLIEFKQGNANAAAEQFKKAIDANHAWRFADLGLAWNNLANCYDGMNKAGDAIKAYESAAKARPEDDLVQYNLARAYQRYEYPDKAIRPYEKAIELMQLKDQGEVGDTYSHAVYNLGDCYMRVHNFRMAAERYDEMLRLKPGMTAAKEKLVRALEAQQRARVFSYDYGTPTVAREDRPGAAQEEAAIPAPEPAKP